MSFFKRTLCIGAALIFAAPTAADTLTYATWQPEASPDLHATSLHWFAEQLSERTGGEHSLQIFWGGTIAGINEIPDAVENRVADMGDLVVPYFPDQFPLNNVISFHLPQPNSPYELSEMMKSLHATYPQFDEELAKYNLKLIGLRPLGYYGILCSKPVSSLEDLKGQRIRPFSVGSAAALTAIGAVPVQMSTVETYEALERGVLDCTAIEPVIGHGQRYDEVAKHYVDVPLGASWGQFIVINADVYKSLPDDLRETIDKLGDEYHTYFTSEQTRLTAEVMKLWSEQADFTITKVPAEQFLAITEADKGVADVRAQWASRAEAAGLPAAEIASKLAF